MQLKAVPLDNVNDVNTFDVVTELTGAAGCAQFLYFQLIDASKRPSSLGFLPAGFRYIPPALSSLTVEFCSIDKEERFVRYATQPFAQDPSIWRVPVLATDPIRGTVTLRFALTEPSGTGFIERKTLLNAAFLNDTQNVAVGNPHPTDW